VGHKNKGIVDSALISIKQRETILSLAQCRTPGCAQVQIWSGAPLPCKNATYALPTKTTCCCQAVAEIEVHKRKKFWTIILIFYIFLSKTIIISPGILTHSFNIKADIGRRKHSKTA
jgi:hypothetical protein